MKQIECFSVKKGDDVKHCFDKMCLKFGENEGNDII